ncbi:hypothetical protein GLOTRDRAFT_122527 [Gloeophyllum trabeum ATCC 11539]|uniref:Uncharacterized protein n=1 Tax=Gloeophyllum trabeum (strain ATCC 11539 / FP-39264 / Madison 617) TaxID=670483 RepID=S7PY57_GLOTA|nr:uncharacterized protein GLOTRDRAFT_122527 [Gloeophyllum trabeum ATCC 11539]EPQ52453.1 hypothetical protein GLOTRDRAFT_122527 [Gloeophyllum trabeum ATCC 11539]
MSRIERRKCRDGALGNNAETCTGYGRGRGISPRHRERGHLENQDYWGVVADNYGRKRRKPHALHSEYTLASPKRSILHKAAGQHLARGLPRLEAPRWIMAVSSSPRSRQVSKFHWPSEQITDAAGKHKLVLLTAASSDVFETASSTTRSRFNSAVDEVLVLPDFARCTSEVESTWSTLLATPTISRRYVGGQRHHGPLITTAIQRPALGSQVAWLVPRDTCNENNHARPLSSVPSWGTGEHRGLNGGPGGGDVPERRYKGGRPREAIQSLRVGSINQWASEGAGNTHLWLKPGKRSGTCADCPDACCGMDPSRPRTMADWPWSRLCYQPPRGRAARRALHPTTLRRSEMHTSDGEPFRVFPGVLSHIGDVRRRARPDAVAAAATVVAAVEDAQEPWPPANDRRCATLTATSDLELATRVPSLVGLSVGVLLSYAMLASFPTPVLALAPDVLKDLEGKEALSGLWALFTKCKESLQDGRRLENISWRLWYAELAASHSSVPSTPSSDSLLVSRSSSHLTAFTEDEKDASRAGLRSSPLLTPIAPPTPSSPTGRHRSPSPHPSSVVSSSHLSVSDIPPARARRSSSVGKIICDLLPEKLVVPHGHCPQRTPSGEEPPPITKTATSSSGTPRSSATATPPRAANLNVSTVPLIQAPARSEVSPPSASTTAASTPQPSGLFPRVVIVNPTPHPTPPATPQMPPNAAPLAIPNSTTLLPPAHPLAKPVNPAALRGASAFPSASVAQPEPSAPAAVKKANDETLKASDRRRFFLHQAESPEKESPERPSPTTEAPPIDEDDAELEEEVDGEPATLVEPGSVASHSSAASAVSTRSKYSTAASSRRVGGGSTTGKARKGKEPAKRPVVHRMHTAGAIKRSASAANVVGMVRTKSGGGKPLVVERTRSAGAGGKKVEVRGLTMAKVEEGKGKTGVKGEEKGKAPGKIEEKGKASAKEERAKSPRSEDAAKDKGKSKVEMRPVDDAKCSKTADEASKGKAKAEGPVKGIIKAEEPVKDTPTKSRPTFRVGSSSSNGTDSVAGRQEGSSLRSLSPRILEASAQEPSTRISATNATSNATAAPTSRAAAAPQPHLSSQSHPAQSARAQPPPQTASQRPPSNPAQGPSTSTQQPEPASHRRGILISESSDYETTDTEGDEDDSWESEEVSDQPPTRAPVHHQNAHHHAHQHQRFAADQNRRTAAISAATSERIRIQEAAMEAQRQRDMFAKLPKRSYSNLQRTQSGLLSQLLNPDPAIFPPEHPYRRSSEDIAGKARGFGLSGFGMTAMGNHVGAPKLQTSKSTASIAEAVPVQVQANVTVPTAGPSNARQQDPKAGYKPKGMPKAGDVEYETDSEDEEGENTIQVSKSLAQQKLAALAGPHRRTSSGQQEQQQRQQQQFQQQQQQRPPVPPNVANRQLPEKPPPLTNRNHTEPQPSRPDRPMLSTVATAPIPLNHPYNLPAPAPPMTPRTTRRQMLATELSESLRRNLLWERQVSKVNMIGRRSGVLGGGLRPLTSTTGQQAGGSGQQEQQGGDSRPKTKEEEREEKRKQAMARNRSWADDYHYSGW